MAPWPLGRLVAAGIGLLAGVPLLADGLINTRAGGDSPFLLVRVHQLAAALEAGVFPVRWMPDAAYGLGYPFFHYYAALPFYLAAALHLAGLSYVASIEAVQWLGLAGAGLGMYLLLRELGGSRTAALLGSASYSYAPFHLVNLYVRGDSLSEFFSFVWFPLILVAIQRLGRSQSPRDVLALALSYGGLVLTHNISALIFTPFALVFGAFVWRSGGSAGRGRPAMLVAGTSLGLGLAAWFWLPALLERDLVQLGEATAGYFHFAGHFRGSDLVQGSPVFDYGVDALGTPFAMGSVQAALSMSASAVLAASWIRNRRLSANEAFWFLSLLAATSLITPLSRPLWDSVPLLPFVQFPWRFLSVQAVASAAVIGLALDRLPGYRLPVAAVAGAGMVVASMGDLRPDSLLVTDADVSSGRIQIYEHFTGNIGSTVRAEYLPRWTSPRPYGSALLATGRLEPAAIEGSLGDASLLSSGPVHQDWELVVVSGRSRVAFPLLYFPGWQAKVDGRDAQVDWVEGSGRLATEISQGLHTVSIRFHTTPLRRLAESTSLAAGVIAVVLLFWRASPSSGGTGIRGLAATSALLGAVLLGVAGQTPAGAADDLSMDFARSPFLHRTRNGVAYGDVATLSGCALSAKSVWVGQELAVDCLWDADSGVEAEVRLASPAEHLFGARDTIAVSRVPVRSGRSIHRLRPEPGAAPGLYYPAVRLFDGGDELPPATQGRTLATVHLHPVRVKNPRPATGTETILARFGEAIALTEIGAAWSTASELQVDLTWWAVRSAGSNYTLSLRLADPSGALVVQRDMQPRYGMYPTADWQPGHLVGDGYVLAMPPGSPTASGYRLTVLLYRSWEAGLPAIGVAEVPVTEAPPR